MSRERPNDNVFIKIKYLQLQGGKFYFVLNFVSKFLVKLLVTYRRYTKIPKITFVKYFTKTLSRY